MATATTLARGPASARPASETIDLSALPEGLPPIPEPPARTPPWLAMAAPVVVGAAPLILMVVSVVFGGGPRTESADDALLTLTTRDAVTGRQLLGPYSRFGWHHPGPSYFYLLSLPTWVWHRAPTGSWVGATLIGTACAAATVAAVRWWAGPRAGWWAAIGTLVVVAGLGPGLLRDPWNPYVVTLPVLFVGVAAAAAAAGARGALPWALVVGSVAVQTHISTAPVVVGMVGLAVVVRAVRWARRHLSRGRAGPGVASRAARGATHVAGAVPTVARRSAPAGAARAHTAGGWDGHPHIPPGLPPLPLAPRRSWRRRPDLAVAVAALAIQWAPPVVDELFGSGNLSKLLSFFSAPHPQHPWAGSWRLTTAIFSITMFQHHVAVKDGVVDPHPLLTTIAFGALAAVAIGAGIASRRPVAVWCGVVALVGGFLAVCSVTRIVGQPFHYLLLWMAVLPVVPLVGAAVGLEGMLATGLDGVAGPWRTRLGKRASTWRGWPSGHAARLASRAPHWVRTHADRAGAGTLATAAAVTVASVLGLVGAANATPAAALTDRDVATLWRLVAPVAGPGHRPVRLEIALGGRWPAAAGVGLELERHGHPVRVDPPWTLLFGSDRRARDDEAVDVVMAGENVDGWPPPAAATLLGQAGPDVVFVRRGGAACWLGWLPFGGPACPAPAPPVGPVRPPHQGPGVAPPAPDPAPTGSSRVPAAPPVTPR